MPFCNQISNTDEKPLSPWKRATKCAENHQVSKTRSGRHVVRPLQFWKNENKRCDAQGNFIQIDAPSHDISKPTLTTLPTPHTPNKKRTITEDLINHGTNIKENLVNRVYVLVETPKLSSSPHSRNFSKPETPVAVHTKKQEVVPFCQPSRPKVVPVKRRKGEVSTSRDIIPACTSLFDQGELVKIAYDEYDQDVDIDGDEPLPPLTLHDLPPEVLLFILSFTGFKGIQTISCVSKALREICMDNLLWKNLYFNTWTDFVVSHRTSPANIPFPLSPKSVLRVTYKEGEKTGLFHGVEDWRDHFIQRKSSEIKKEEKLKKQTRLQLPSFENVTCGNKKRRLSQESSNMEDYLQQQREYFKMIDQQPLLVI